MPAVFQGTVVVDARFVERAHEQGLEVHVWTIDDPVEARRLIALGVDGIMSDVPEIIRAALDADS